MKRTSLFAALVSLSFTVGCVSSPKVTRVYDGRVVQGSYVPPEAYAAFLRGALAEESGDLARARSAYEEVLEDDDEDPLVWARLGEVACKQGSAEARETARRAFAKAKDIDPTYAGALVAEARCALASGDAAKAAVVAGQASAADPGNVDVAATLVRAEAKKPASPEARARALALTSAHGEHVAAWDALLAWGRAHADDELVTRGLVGLGRLAPLRSREVEAGALDLVARKQLANARLVAASLADAPRENGHHGPHDDVVARLAVDEAIARGDGLVARRRAARGHVLLAEVAARAVVLGKKDLAGELARELSSADPAASGPAMVIAAITPDPRALELGSRSSDVPPALCAFVLAERIAATSGVEAARTWLSRARYAPAPERDPLALALATALAERGILVPGKVEKATASFPRDTFGG